MILVDYFAQLDPILLSRLQFAFVVSFHILFPAFTIGLASYLAMLEFLWIRTENSKYLELYKFWMKIFAVTFGMGVVSGVVMSYQFGTNWAPFSDKISNVIGPLLSYEVMTAFFLEASFLGIMLFGFGRVSKKAHFAATLIVAIGTLVSAFWILAANSFMHTPQGFIVDNYGRLHPLSWLAIIFNPSFPYRFVHMILAAYLTTAFVVGGVGAWYLLKKRYKEHARIMLLMATLMVSITAPLQIFAGDLHGLNTLKYQPVKVAAIEGIWETEKGAALRIFGVPDEVNEMTKYSVEVPGLASLILKHDIEGEILGLKEWAPSERPPVIPVFFAFRIMVGIGMLMLLVALVSIVQLLSGKLMTHKLTQRMWCFMIPSGFIALLSGWIVTEVGRQPYLVYDVLRTAENASNLAGIQVLWSLLMFGVVYAIVFGAGIYYIVHLVKKGIKEGDVI